MDEAYEELIVKAFFNKGIQERIIYELSSEAKRKHAIGRLSHNYLDILKPQCLGRVQEACTDYVKILEMLKSQGAGDNCYSISFCEEIDGRYMRLKDAIKHAFGYGLPSLVVCQGLKLGYFEAEQEYGAPPRFILRKDI